MDTKLPLTSHELLSLLKMAKTVKFGGQLVDVKRSLYRVFLVYHDIFGIFKYSNESILYV